MECSAKIFYFSIYYPTKQAIDFLTTLYAINRSQISCYKLTNYALETIFAGKWKDF